MSIYSPLRILLCIQRDECTTENIAPSFLVRTVLYCPECQRQQQPISLLQTRRARKLLATD